MSWSIGANGNKEDVLKTIKEQVANNTYRPGTPEGDDVVSAGARIEALLAALAPGQVKVNAYGSHSTTDSGITSATFTVSVSIAS